MYPRILQSILDALQEVPKGVDDVAMEGVIVQAIRAYQFGYIRELEKDVYDCVCAAEDVLERTYAAQRGL